MELTLPPLSQLRRERPWDTYFTAEGRDSILINVGSAIQMAVFTYETVPALQEQGNMSCFIEKNFLKLKNSIDVLTPHFQVEDCVVDENVTPYRVDSGQLGRNLYCAKLLSRELLVDSVVRHLQSGKLIRIEMRLKLTRRWMNDYLHRHKAMKAIMSNHFVNRTVHN
jgi:hypothetical protein